jgi:RHS repeat-associated protein
MNYNTTIYLVDDRNPSGYAQVMEEYTNTGENSQATLLSRSFNYGLNLISQQQFDPVTLLPSVLSYYGYDGHGNVRFLMDTNGIVTDTYMYDAFGNIIATTGSGTPNNYLYCGQQWDPDLGVYYNRARYLNTDAGRFLSPDSTDGDQEDPLSLHKYLYGADNPVNRIDPTGHDDIGDLMVGMDISAGLDALPNLTTIQGALSGGNTCGPDINVPLMNTMNDVEQTYLHAPYATKGLIAMETPWGMGGGWDIDKLVDLGFPNGKPDFGNGSILGTGRGAQTVQFGNPPKVYYAGSVNYILWGRIFSLLNYTFPLSAPQYSESAAVTEAWLYKSIFWRDFGMTKTEADAFVRFGYSATDPSSTALPIAPNPKNVADPARFKWQWLGLHDTQQ